MNFKQLVLYGIFGVLTTIINIVSYWALTRLFGLRVVTSTVLAWLAAVFFAYYTNRKYVFQSKNSSFFAVIFEAAYFFACRIATGLLDVVIMYVFADVLGLYDVAVKVVSNVIVVILNYVASKLFIFKGKKEA